MTNLKLKTALAAVTLAAATIAMPLSASANDYKRKCADTSNGVLGAVVGGTAGAAIGESIAGRGDRTEGAILGAIIGGIAGAAVGDSASGCENDTRYVNRGHTTTNHYPVRNNRVQTTTRGYQTVGHNTHRNTRGYTDNRGYNRNYNQGQNRLYQIDRKIEQLRQERAYLKDERRRSRNYRPGIERRLDRISYRLAELKRERKQIKRYSDIRRNDYRPQPTRRGHYHGQSRNLCYSDH
ncbi:hypothetical protein GCM10011309_00520 [Litorimonas cladophorae]|uniref:17 kDa surface antigen n=1 Tax=Litorimonas cladophorae TaxID=1220491 RepID=A0A918K9B3_9PROT|nr:glycine zipper 2TM domain-containing protein [Litorimonas cladophorae]GGX55768.1 hypothetical protein GCM10011309_00520 [Litorimonas cladophorae]